MQVGNAADALIRRGRQITGSFPPTVGSAEVLYRTSSVTGRVTHYQIYDLLGLPVKRVYITGSSHGGVPTPHVLEFVHNTNPRTGQVFVNTPLGGLPRPATQDEVPLVL